MITDAVLGWLLDAADWLVGLMPSSNLNTGGLATALGNLGSLDYFIPITEAYAVTILFWKIMFPSGLVSLAIWVVVGILRGGSTKA